jgi:hypothetical protein
MRIGRPATRNAPVASARLNDYAERLVTGRLPSLADFFGFSERTVGVSRRDSQF